MSDEARRMTRGARREQVLDAAAGVVAHSGFTGTTTDAVARAAGVSQPYVVRMFGSKQELLAAPFERVSGRVLEAFRVVPAGQDAAEAPGGACVRLLRDRDLLRVMLQGFGAGSDAVVGARARAVLAEVFRVFRERTGRSAEQARDFLAQGMLVSVLLAVGAPDHLGEDADPTDLAVCAFGVALDGVPPGAPAVPGP